MGERISIQFHNPDSGMAPSVAFFDHWGGPVRLLDDALDYVQELNSERDANDVMYPLDRRAPNTIMIDFIRWIALKRLDLYDRITSGWYLGVDGMDGDNSDWGHHIIDARTGHQIDPMDLINHRRESNG